MKIGRAFPWGLVVVLAMILAAVGVRELDRMWHNSFTILESSRVYRFDGQFLSERQATEIAAHAMAVAGMATGEWRPVRHDNSKAPDGTADVYFARNPNDPDEGFVDFQYAKDPADHRTVYLNIRRNGDGYTISLNRGK